MAPLPVPLDSFVGRDEELADAGRLLAESRLLTVVGPGGVGKTRLALELARRIESSEPDEIWLVDLSAARGDVPAQVVAAAVGIREELGDGLVEALPAVLGLRQGLLVLDNCEQVVGPVAKLVEALLRRCPHLRTLATSQELLGVPGEVVFPLGGLALPAQPGRPAGAVRLFVDRARASRPDLELTPPVAEDVTQICARLDGLPLSIELAARWVRSLSAAEILARLDDRFELLTASPRTVAERHRSLRAVIEWSYHLLDARERAAFRQLAALPGGFDLDAAAALCGEGGGTRGDEVLHLIDQLQAKSLVVRVETARGVTRFRMLESIRLFAAEQLAVDGETEVANGRLAGWLATLCAPLVEQVFQSPVLLGRLDEERDNLAAAVDAAITAGDERAGLLATALAACWRRLGWVDRGRALVDAVLEHGLDPHGVALNMAALLASDQADYDTARRLANAVIDAERPRGASASLIRALQTLVSIADDLGDHATAEAHLTECVRLAPQLGRPLLTAMCRQNLAWGVLQTGDLDRAEALLTDVLPELRRLAPEPAMLSGILHSLGVLALKSGDVDRAEAHFRENLTVSATDLLGTRYALDGLALVSAERGDAERALRLATASDSFADRSAPMSEVVWKQQVDKVVAECRDELGTARAAEVLGEAGRLSVEEITAYALHDVWPRAAAEPGVPALSDREREVARLVAEGLTNREIAARLSLSSRTVDSHLEHIRTKLGLRSRAQVAAWATSSAAD